MNDKYGLEGFWEDIGSYLSVNIDVIHSQSSNAKYPAILRFLVTNTARTEEGQPDIVYEEVQLKVGIPPNLHIKKLENFARGQSFSYDHHCNYADIAKVQWTIEGKMSPTFLLNFRQRPGIIPKVGKLPVKAYFDHLTNLNIHQWLEETVKNMTVPDPDSTLCEMKAEESSLERTPSEISDAVQQIQDLLVYIDCKKYHDEVVKHKNIVEEYLKRTEAGIADLIKIRNTQSAQVFNEARNKIVVNLTKRAAELDKATNSLAKKVGVLKKEEGS